jgi:probable F420-dependent oxidoreductase
MIPESLCYPERATARYPYNPDGTREFLNDTPFIEPLLLVAHLAAVTTRLRFVTSVVKLPIRHPVQVAKQVTSLAVLTGNRFAFGVGTSPWREDYDICHVPWHERGARMDEAIEIVRALATGGYAEYHGTIYDVPSIKLCPVPSAPIPIIIGGHGNRALRRAARLGDGWTAASADDERLGRMIARLMQLRAEVGREHSPFEVYAGSPRAFTADGVRMLEELGVTEAYVAFRDPYTAGPDTETLAQKIDALRGYAESVIAKV